MVGTIDDDARHDGKAHQGDEHVIAVVYLIPKQPRRRTPCGADQKADPQQSQAPARDGTGVIGAETVEAQGQLSEARGGRNREHDRDGPLGTDLTEEWCQLAAYRGKEADPERRTNDAGPDRLGRAFDLNLQQTRIGLSLAG